MNKIKVFRLINGEDLIVEIFNSFDAFYEVKNPANIILQPNQNGQMAVAMSPYMPYAAGNINLYKTSITSEGEPDAQMENEYRRIFGSGIQIVPPDTLSALAQLGSLGLK